MTEKRRIIVNCQNCGKQTERRPSDLKWNKSGRSYCSKKCIKEGRSKFISLALKGREELRANGKRNFKHLTRYYENGNKPWNFSEEGKGLTCSFCGKSFDVHPCKIREGKAKYCSQECYDKIRFNPNIKEEVHARLLTIYKKWRLAVLKRDDHTCQKCGKEKTTLRSIHAHHINEFQAYPALRNELSNGITLCIRCHHKIHFPNKNKEDSNVRNMQMLWKT